METIKLFIKSALIDNVVFIQYLAICPFIGMTNDTEKATGMGLATTFVIMLATAVTWPLYKLVMVPLGLEFLQTLFFILVIASLVQLVEFFLKKMSPGLYNAMGVYLALITTNCAVLGVVLLNVQNSYNILESVANGFATSVGFTLAICILAGIRERIDESEVPLPFRGMPIVMITAGLMSIAFIGFAGLR
jgi:electron transport complex protein RnfA